MSRFETLENSPTQAQPVQPDSWPDRFCQSLENFDLRGEAVEIDSQSIALTRASDFFNEEKERLRRGFSEGRIRKILANLNIDQLAIPLSDPERQLLLGAKNGYQIISEEVKEILLSVLAAQNLQRHIGQVAIVSEQAGDLLDREPESQRFIVATESNNGTRKINPAEIGLSEVSQDSLLTPDSEELTAEVRADMIVNYLYGLTLEQHQDNSWSGEYRQNLLEKIKKAIEEGKEIVFSVYLTMRKFPNPFTTSGSSPDLAEVAALARFSELIKNIEALSNNSVKLVILNEAAANPENSNGSDERYLTESQRILENFGMIDKVEFVNFDESFFINYLRGLGLDEAEARDVFDDVYNLISQIYTQFSNAKKGGIEEILSSVSFSSAITAEKSGELMDFLRQSADGIFREVQLALRSHIRGCVDPSRLYPKLSASLYKAALYREYNGLPQSQHNVADNLRSNVVRHAIQTGLKLKVMMRMRYAVKAMFGKPILNPEYIPLTVTGADNKNCLPVRSRDTGIYIEGQEVAGVLPQHGVGVKVGSKVVAIPLKSIIEAPGSFRPVSLSINNLNIKGYEYIG